jgi:triphosphoribosyl-dephospho-CoA synthase
MAAMADTMARRGTCASTSVAEVPARLPDAQLARLAVDALIDEAQLTPKPALVDRRGSGAHRDLDLAKMIRSAHALEPTFAALSRASRNRFPSATLRAELAQIGRTGEIAMMQATGGSNAHRGAIWILGLLVAGAAIRESTPSTSDVIKSGFTELKVLSSGDSDVASGNAVSRGARGTHCAAENRTGPAARLAVATIDRNSATSGASLSASASRICTVAAQIACFPDRFAAPTDSHGERVRSKYRVGGARLEAQEGFPHVIDVGLPTLAAARANGIAEDAARIDTLLAIMASLDDTCLLHRAGLAGLHAGKEGARRVLACGGSSTAEGRVALVALESGLMSLNASPGGAADLLAATLFIDKLASHDAGGSAASWNI